MSSARRARRPLTTLLGITLAVGSGLASCASGELTEPRGNGGANINGMAKSGNGNAGASGMLGAGTGQGGMSAGGMVALGGTFATAGSSGSLGSSGTGTGNAGAGGVAGSAAGFGGMSVSGASGSFGQGGAVSGGMSGSFGNGGRAGGGGGGAAGMAAGTSNAGYGNNGAGVAPPPDIQGGANAWASRYWDCCKPACGWLGNVGGRTPMKACSKENQTLSDVAARNACESGGSAFACWGDRPWAVGDKLSYGFAAASGPNYSCGRCFHVQFTGSSHNGGMNAGAQSLQGKHMIIQVINNGGVAQDQFDLLIPGGGVGLLNACSNQWGTSDLGAQYGGFLSGCNGDVACVRNKCQTIFNGKPELMEGCNWFLGWFNAADNPNFTYKQIACPQEITQRSGLSDPG